MKGEEDGSEGKSGVGITLSSSSLPIPVITSEDRKFLLLIHAMSKLAQWVHNRELITNVFGNLFFVVTSSCVSTVIRKVEDLLTIWNEIENTPDLPNYLSFSQLVLSSILGLTQLLSRFASNHNYIISEIYSINNITVPSYSLKTCTGLHIDLLMKSNHLVHVSPQVGLLRQSSDPNIISLAKKKPPKSSHNKSLKPEESMSFVLPILMNSLRKLYLFCKNVGTSSHFKEFSQSYNALLTLSLLIHNETIVAASNMIYSWPQLLAVAQNCDCSGSIGAFLNLKDAYYFNSLAPVVKVLVFQRSMLVLHYHDVALKACLIVKTLKKTVLKQLQDCFRSVESVFSFYIEEIKRNRSKNKVVPKAPGLKVRSESVSRINSHFPFTDLFPWSLNTHTTTAMFRSKMTELTQEYEASFTTTVGNYWKERKSFIPVQPSDLLADSKFYLAYVLKLMESQSASSSSDGVDDPVLALLQVPEVSFIHRLFQLLLLVTWKLNEKSLSFDEKKDLLQEILKMVLNLVKSNGVSSFGDSSFVICAILFLMQSFNMNQEDTVRFTKDVSFWREFLGVILPRRENEPKLDSLIQKYLVVRKNGSLSSSFEMDSYCIEGRSSLVASNSAEQLSSLDMNDEKAGKSPAATSSSSPIGSEEYGELVLSYRLFVIDMTLEILWLFTSYKTLQNSSVSPPSSSSPISETIPYDDEDWALIDCVSSSTTDCSVFVCFRWFVNLVHLNSKLSIKSKVWFEVLRKGLLLLKALNDPVDDSRPYFWPSKVTVIRLLAYVMYACQYEEWFPVFTVPVASINPSESAIPFGSSLGSSKLFSGSEKYGSSSGKFLPTSSAVNDLQPEGPSSSGKLSKHLVLFRIALDDRCRTFASAMLMRLLYACSAESYQRSLRKKQQGQHATSNDYGYSIKEILAHDILKCIFNIIKNRNQHGKKLDGVESSKALIQGLIVLLRFPSTFAAESDMLLEGKHIQNLFMSYGTFTAKHKNAFNWTHSRHNIMKDLIICLDFGVESENVAEIDLLVLGITFYTAFMSKNESAQVLFRNLVNSVNRRRRSLSNTPAMLAMMSLGLLENRSQHDLVQLICSVIGKKQESLPVFLALFECLLNVFPYHLRTEFEQLFSPTSSVSFCSVHAVPVPATGFFSKTKEPLIIRNVEVLNVILSLVPSTSAVAQSCILNSVISLFNGKWGSIKNFTTSTTLKPTVIDILLDIFGRVSTEGKRLCIKLLEIFGSFSITVAELKRVIQVLRQSDESSLVTSTYLIDALRGTLADSDDPQFYFLFEGKDGGILLPPFSHWPCNNGYTFFTWFSFNNHVEQGAVDQQTSMVLFSVLQPSGYGFEILATPQTGNAALLDLEIVIHSKGSSPLTKTLYTFSLEFSLKTWHFFAITQTKGTLLNRSQLVIVFDDQVSKKEVSFPKFKDGAPVYSGIGCVHPPNSNTTAPTDRTAFFGRMSTVFLYSEALSLPLLQYVEKVGFTKFHEISNNLEELKLTTVPGSGLVVDLSLLQSLILAYNPGIASKGIVYNSINDNSINGRWIPCVSDSNTGSESISSRAVHNPNMDGTILNDTYVCSSRDMRNALDCLGGIKVILPLFYHVIEVGGGGIGKEEEEEMSLRFCEILKLFVITLRDTFQNKNFMISNGFSFLTYFIGKMDSSCVGIGVVAELAKMLDRFPSDKEWSMHCLNKIFCEFSVWSLTPYTTQLLLLQTIQNYSMSNGDVVRERIGIQRFFDALYLFYTERPSRSSVDKEHRDSGIFSAVTISTITSSHYNSSSNNLTALGSVSGKESFHNQVTSIRRHNGSRLHLLPNELIALRSCLWDIIFFTIANSSSEINKEIEALINYIAFESFPHFKIEGMQLLLRLLNPERIDLCRRIFEGLCSCNGLMVLSNLQSNMRAKVRVYVWITVCYILHITLLLSGTEYYQGTSGGPFSPGTASAKDGLKANESSKKKGVRPQSSLSEQIGFDEGGEDALNNKRLSRDVTNQSSAGGVLFQAKSAYTTFTIGSENDIWKKIGLLDQFSITAWLTDMWQRNVEVIRSTLFDAESIIAQLKLIFFILDSTMYGRSCKFLMNEIEKIPLTKAELENVHHPKIPSASQFPIDISVDQYDLEGECQKICIPMIFPALVELLKSNICDFPIRIELFQSIFTNLKGIENYDIITNIPKWQSVLLDFYCEVEHQIREFVHRNSSSSSSSVSTSTFPPPIILPGAASGSSLRGTDQQIMSVIIYTTKLVDIIAEIFSNLHTTAVQFGELKNSKFRIELPSKETKLSSTDFLSYPIKDILEIIRRDQRALGCSGILKTVSYIRGYASQGLIDWEDLGTAILQLIINTLHGKVVELRQSTLLDDIDKDVRLKIYELNVWLTVEAICEFIAVPPTQLVSHHHSKSSYRLRSSTSATHLSTLSSSTAMYSAITPGTQRLLPIRRGTSAPEHDANTIDLEHGTSFHVSINRKRSGSEGEIISEAAVPDDIDINNDHFATTNLENDVIPSILHPYSRSSRPDLPSRDKSPPLPTIPSSAEMVSSSSMYLDNEAILARHEQLMNDLVTSLVQLLGLNEKGSGSWLTHDRLKRFETGLKVGFTRGRYVLHTLQESVESLIHNESLTSSPSGNAVVETPTKSEKSFSSSVQSPKASQPKLMLDRVIDRSLWLLLRVLLKISLNMKHVDDEAFEYNISATNQMSYLLNWAKTMTKTSYDEESLYVLATLTTSIYNMSTAARFTVWMRFLLKTIFEIALAQKTYLEYALRNLGYSYLWMSQSNSNGDARPTSPQTNLFSNEKRHNSFEIPTEKVGVVPVSPSSARSSYSESESCSEELFPSVESYLITKIGLILNIKKETPLNWEEWNKLMAEIIKNSSNKEMQFVSSRLDHIGLHKLSEETLAQLEHFRRAQSDFLHHYDQNIRSAASKASSSEQKLLKQFIKLEQHEKRNLQNEWEALYAELCNERAPWGTGLIDDGDVSFDISCTV
jgi:hypothetical protein